MTRDVADPGDQWHSDICHVEADLNFFDVLGIESHLDVVAWLVTLAPAYDLLSIIAYIPDDESALKFHHSREWKSFTHRELEMIADKARLPSHLVISTAKEIVERFDTLWDQE